MKIEESGESARYGSLPAGAVFRRSDDPGTYVKTDEDFVIKLDDGTEMGETFVKNDELVTHYPHAKLVLG